MIVTLLLATLSAALTYVISKAGRLDHVWPGTVGAFLFVVIVGIANGGFE